jgi:gluconate 5-dehydrogenase
MDERLGQFAEQTALVTGTTTGIGRVVAGQLAAGGAHVVISGRDRSRNVVAFLASPRARYVSGTNVVVDGGITA